MKTVDLTKSIEKGSTTECDSDGMFRELQKKYAEWEFRALAAEEELKETRIDLKEMHDRLNVCTGRYNQLTVTVQQIVQDLNKKIKQPSDVYDVTKYKERLEMLRDRLSVAVSRPYTPHTQTTDTPSTDSITVHDLEKRVEYLERQLLKGLKIEYVGPPDKKDGWSSSDVLDLKDYRVRIPTDDNT